eukprot:gnl/MRDRNA2_/MRDRNA2_73738_c1_seq2.p1 gnl/MRDRNA2_/MRDRNA2_73738_c1~~gnl/MRDRNA2_/MRDRNA2_73738_c1_seq2.p1  ORF type:complete len:518 (-),score=147.43 gnl/MRDRNA2_/MRDRNA2_73738_c1_seq2:289-1842(-)
MGMSKTVVPENLEVKKVKRIREEEHEMCPEPPKKKKKDKVQVENLQNQESISPSTTELATDKPAKKKKKRQAEDAAEEVVTTSKEEETQINDGEGTSSAVEFRKKMQITSRTHPDNLPDPVQSFDEAPFKKSLRKALKSAGFAAPTAIQAQGWPVVAQGDDLVAIAKTGSGKTLGFLLPAFKKILALKPDCSTGPAVLVLAPTRELAVQIEAEAMKFSECVDVTTKVIYGGVPKPAQLKDLKSKPQVLVATPGRLVDFLTEGAVGLSNVSYLVLDEADRMLDMGFEPQMDQIMKHMPAERQTLLFSATWPKSIQKLAAKYLKADAVNVNVGETEDLAANKAITQTFMKSDDDEKDVKLYRYLTNLDDKAKVIVFGNTKNRINKLQKAIWDNLGWDTVAMHGDKVQKDRDAGLAKFLSGEIQIMLATDVCARGLDIKGVTNVVNYDMARDVESYVHRIGRTGRAGATGDSFTFFNEAYDMGCAPALVKIAKEAGQDIPDWLAKAAEKAGKSTTKQWRY